MGNQSDQLNIKPLAGGQSLRAPGASRTAQVYDQLYAYAEDFQRLFDEHATLNRRYDVLRDLWFAANATQESLLRMLRDSGDMHIVTNDEGWIVHVNAAAEALAPRAQLIGSNLRDWILPSRLPNFEGMVTAITTSPDEISGECELTLCHGPDRKSCKFVAVKGFRGTSLDTASDTHWVMRDLTQLKEIQFETQVTRKVLDNATDGIVIVGLDATIIAVNPAFTRITGYTAEEAIGQNPRILHSDLQDAAFYKEFWRSLTEDGEWRGEICNRRKNGEFYTEWLSICAARDIDGKVLTYIGVFTDLTGNMNTENKLVKLAYFDPLTGMPNRRLFRDRLQQSVLQSRRTGDGFTLLFLDLDRFKKINDTLGHPVGDQVLQATASRLQQSVRQVDTVSRIGGDEFVIIAPGLAGMESISQLCDKLLSALSQPIHVDGHELFVGCSFGSATFPQDGEDADTLLKNADAAMYRAKDRGGNCLAGFEASQSADPAELLIEAELRHALERHELELVYQPQVDARGRLLGVEALLRWNNPRLGQVPPAGFLALANELGVIHEIGHWVLGEACRQMSVWDREGIDVPTVAVNISLRQLRAADLVDTVADALSAHGLTPGRLELEFAEADIIVGAHIYKSKLHALNKLGVRIVIHDFGTSLNELARLTELPIDRLKLDRQWVNRIAADDRTAALGMGVVSLARALEIELVAVGVETSEQWKVLQENGCRLSQGYLTGRAMPAAALGDFCRTPEQSA